eukprot:CCRYP_011914-RC/>CCRYP_011914-RC protein AED:0.04 eAED:0.04 QI:148/1/1/1/1/1/3/369/1668
MASSSACTSKVTPSIARFRQLIAEKKLQCSTPPSEDLAERADSISNSNNVNNENANNENHHPNNASQPTASHTPAKSKARTLGSARIRKLAESPSEDNVELESSTWAMMGNHLDETMDDASFASMESAQLTFHTCDLAITPANFKNAPSDDDEWRDDEIRELLFSPLFKEKQMLNDGPMENAPEHTTKNANASTSSGLNLNEKDENQPKGVKWDLGDGGMETPKNSLGHTAFRKSPCVKGEMTPTKGQHERPDALNESVVISDDEEEDFVSEEVHGDLFHSDANNSNQNEGFEDVGGSIDSPPSIRPSRAFEEDSSEETVTDDAEDHDIVGVSGMAPTVLDSHAASTNTSPTKANLRERLKFLATEVRFADQTCVELSEKLKNEKSKTGRYEHDLGHAKEENNRLLKQHESIIQENAKLKAMFQAQKEQTSLQLEEYRAQIANLEASNRSHLSDWECRYQSHLKNTENQINALNERLAQSLAVNSTLQTKLDKWESKLTSDQSSQDIISALKERAESAESSASKADATIQAMQARIYDLQGLCDQKQNTIQRERNEREMVEIDRDNLLKQCEELHQQLTDWHHSALDTSGELYFNDDGSALQDFIDELKFTPVKGVGYEADADHRTPTSNLLARTLRSELKRRNDALNQLEVAELEVEKLENALSELRMDFEEVKANNELMEEELQEKCLCIKELNEELSRKDAKISVLMEEIDLIGTESVVSLDGIMGSSSNSNQGITTKEMQHTIEDLEDRLQVTEVAMESTEDELLFTRRKLHETETLSDEIAGQLESAEQELADAKHQILEYDDQYDSLKNELNEVIKELQETKDFSEFQTRTVDAMKTQCANNEKRIKEFSIQLKSSLQALVKVEKILRTYEDSDDLAKKKLGEQSRKITRLEDTIKGIKDYLSTRDSESSSSETPMTHLLAQSPMTNLSSVWTTTPESALSGDSFYLEKLSELRSELSSAQDRCCQIEKERDDVSNELKRALQCVQEYRDEISNQEHEHAEETRSLRSQVENTLAQKEELVRKCQQLETKVSTISNELTKQTIQNNTSARGIAAAQNEASRQMAVVLRNNAEALKENESLRLDLNSLKLELENVNSLLKACNAECEGSHKEVKAARAAFECLQAESLLTKTNLINIEENCSKLKNSLAHKEEELKTITRRLTEVNELLECERTKFAETKQLLEARFQEEMKRQKATIDDLEFQITETEELRKASDESFQNASDRIKVLESMMQTKDHECELLKAECSDLTALLQKKSGELTNLENNLAGAEEELNEAQTTMHDQLQRIEQLNAKVEESKLCMGAYEESLVNYERQVHCLQNENSNLERELQDCLHGHQSIMFEKENQINKLKEALCNRQNLFDEQLAKAKQERDTATADFEAMVKMLQTQLHSKDENVEQTKSLLAEKERLLIEKDSIINECTAVISDLKAEVLEQNESQNKLEDEMIRKQGQIETLQNSLTEAEEEVANATGKLYSLEMTYEDLVQSKAAVQRELDSSLMDIERLKMLHQDDQSTSNSLIKDLKSEIDSLYSYKISAQDSVSALTEEMRVAKEKLEKAEKKLKDELQTKTKQHNDISELLVKNASLTKKCDIFKEKMKQLNNKVRDWEASYKLQNQDLVDYGREISRLNTEKNTLKEELLAVRGVSVSITSACPEQPLFIP